MIVVNEKLKSNIECTFGEYGKRWIDDLPNKIDNSLKLWNLEVLKEVKNLSFNYVLICKSTKYGEVILKICPEEGNYNQESAATKLLNSKQVRSCLEYSKDNNALLLEFIKPGITLHSLENQIKQISIGTELIKVIPRKIDKNQTELSTYKSALEKAFTYVLNRNLGGEDLKRFIEISKGFYSQLENVYKAEYICHGDFHHENIIFDERRGWIAIDPKGFISFWFTDIGRFVLNQLWKVSTQVRDRMLNEILETASKKLQLPVDVVFKTSFIETVLCYCWQYQGDYTNEGYIKLKTDMLNDILPYINSDLFKDFT